MKPSTKFGKDPGMLTTTTSELGPLREALAGLSSADWADTVSGEGLGEVMLELTQLKATLAAVELEITGAFDRSNHWQSPGARTPAAWLRSRTRGRDSDMKRQVRLARKARSMPVTFAALMAGTVAMSHVELLARACAEGREALFERDEALLVRQAHEPSFKFFAKAVLYWIQVADDTLGKEPVDKNEGRGVHCSQSLDGVWFLDGHLGPLEGLEFNNELERLCDIEFNKDWAEATDRLGRTPTVEDLARTPAQRRADALLEMARRSATTSAPGEAAARVITLRMDYGTFIAETAHMTGARDVDYPTNRCSETAQGAVIAPSTMLHPDVATCVRRIVFDSAGEVLERGRTERLFRGALADAIAERDRQCRHPYCETDARWCQTDHITEREDGGGTDIGNGQLLCGFHNRLKHHDKRKARAR